MPIDLSTLNEPQRQAVERTEGPLLVLAGAGSGKTRVLTYRIAHLVNDLGVAPWEILAITFTNKAAKEMRERVGQLVGPRARGMWVSTFHSMCVRILRADAERLGFTRSFTIYDDADSNRLVKEIMAQLDIDPRRFPIRAIRGRISEAKNELKVPADFSASVVDPVGKVAARVYEVLQQRLRGANALDFDDLLLYGFLLLKHHPEVLEAYRARFRYLMVDEYQDTNHAQYQITRLLAEKHRNIMVVGDDDQSIYSWRGADLRNILDFEHDYPGCAVVKLEQNYRSMGNILKAANAVIANNAERKVKNLFTDQPDGEPIKVYAASDERDEGRWVAGRIEQRHGEGMSYAQMAVFYRTNAQSRMIEDMFLRAGVPYRIVGGTRFFERQEISDVMAYLTLVVNPADDIAAKRVINVPRRGVGKTTVEYLEAQAREQGLTFMEAAEMAQADMTIRAATRSAIGEFLGVVREGATYSGDLRKVVEAIIDKAGLIAALEREGTEEAFGRVENIKEFLGVVDEFADTHTDDDALFEAPTVTASPSGEAAGAVAGAGLSATGDAAGAADVRADAEGEGAPPVRVLRGDSLPDLIEWIRLRTDLDSVSEDGQAVTLMTIHASKGLEFDCVFVVGMEESLFPSMRTMQDPAGVEEERRLAYVAITRARRQLCLTYATQRTLYGQTQVNPVSRFVHEIPDGLRSVTGVGSAGFSGTGWEKRGSRRGIAGSGTEAGGGRVYGRSSAAGSAQRARDAGGAQAGRPAPRTQFAVGDAVSHKTFGAGHVTKVEGDAIHVRFSKLGQVKKLLVDYAPIVKVEGPAS
ncbi:UvrD-helicase domain-containing protein [Eggerthellaceae bacterium zg-997]|nr:UvrD-helicase domain-containing protein [Eggerthellaceae bacterium zg-997]